MRIKLSVLLLVGCILGRIEEAAAASDTLFYNYINSGKIVGQQWDAVLTGSALLEATKVFRSMA